MDCKWSTHWFIHCTFPFKSPQYTLSFVGSCWKQDWLRMLIFSDFLFFSFFLIDPHCKNHSYGLSGLKINLFPRFPSNRLLTQINRILATALNPDGLDLFLHTSATPLWKLEKRSAAEWLPCSRLCHLFSQALAWDNENFLNVKGN